MTTIARRGAAVLAAILLTVLVAQPASAAEPVAPGITYESFALSTTHGPVVGYRVTIDLRNPRVRLDLLHPPHVAERQTVSAMATAQRAVAGVNGDFFNISETHAGIPPTGSSVGPEITGGRDLKFAVPDGQTFGPKPPAGDSTKDVFGMGVDHRARIGTLTLRGSVRTKAGSFAIEGLNQYALPVNGIGVYTRDWGQVSRARATCGTDTDRNAPCATETEEVVVRHGVVVSEAETPGAGDIPADTVVLVGREAGADELESLAPGDHVGLFTRMVADTWPFQFAIGGFRILQDGVPLSGLDTVALAPRTAAGVSADGRTASLVVVDGRSAASTGMSLAELADLLRSFGARDGVNLDGGGSSTLVTAERGQPVTVRNVPSDGAERAVANGVGVFTGR